MDSNVVLVKDEAKAIRSIKSSMVRSLLYATTATRPDIAFAVGRVSKFSSAPTTAHLTAVKRIFRYLKGTMHLGLCYEKTANVDLIGYSDADWAGDHDDRHSTSGHVFLMANGAVCWSSRKQSLVHGFIDFRSEVCGMHSALQLKKRYGWEDWWLTSLRICRRTYQSVWRQPRNNCYGKEPGVSSLHQTYWYQVPLCTWTGVHALLTWSTTGQRNPSDLLPNWKYASWFVNQVTFSSTSWNTSKTNFNCGTSLTFH